MQRMVQAVPDISLNVKSDNVRKRSAVSNDSSFDEGEDVQDQSVPKQKTGNAAKVSRSAVLDDQIVKLIDSKVDSINDNFKEFLKEVKVIKEEIGIYVKPLLKGDNVINYEQSRQNEHFEDQLISWQAEAQEMKKALNWSPLDDIMVHSQVFKKAANNERQSLEPTKQVYN